MCLHEHMKLRIRTVSLQKSKMAQVFLHGGFIAMVLSLGSVEPQAFGESVSGVRRFCLPPFVLLI